MVKSKAENVLDQVVLKISTQWLCHVLEFKTTSKINADERDDPTMKFVVKDGNFL